MRRQAGIALLILTALNFLNYVDRWVLNAVLPLIKLEFPNVSNAQYGMLQTAFLVVYTISAPCIALIADRTSRKWLIVGGALLWSLATLLTAWTYTFNALLVRHAIVGIGEASFVTIAPGYIADLFAHKERGRKLAVFYMALPAGTALGLVIGGYFGAMYGWRTPFYLAAVPGLVLAAAMAFTSEPQRGGTDDLAHSVERDSLRGLLVNRAFWVATLGMAALYFGMGGIQNWIIVFLVEARHQSVTHATAIFGVMTIVNGIGATLLGGWLGDRMLQRSDAGYYKVSAIGLAIATPLALLATRVTGVLMWPAIFIAVFFILLNTGPLNAAVVDSVSANIRSTAIAVNLIATHFLGDAPASTFIGWVKDKTGSWETAFLAGVVALALGAIILFYGMRYAPTRRSEAAQATA